MTASIKLARIAVVLPVRDGEEFLAEAVRSVLAQTFDDFELIVVDDGSTDGTAALLSDFRDDRIRVIRFPEHRGLVQALNCAIRESRSEFIARMDADDICMPRRLERQVAFMNAHPQVDACGSWTRVFGHSGGVRRQPVASEQVRARMFFGGAIDHPTLMVRRAFVDRNGLAYDDDFRHAEDLDFLIRAAERGRLANVPESLLLYRVHGGQVSEVHRQDQSRAYERLLWRQLELLVPDGSDQEKALHVRLAKGEVGESEMTRAERWLSRLERANVTSGRYDPVAFIRELRRIWFYAHDRHPLGGVPILASYWRSPLAGIGDVGVLRHCRLVARCLAPKPAKRFACP